ncbi:Hypothetical protein PYTT_1411 [Akkermansia glycaniphila]|uniref:AsmA family protein n=2 Tax=Akkermansia glycaniphila TaxID=1679444 RepID=A0A1H6LR55_9BACT|nr:Hypothetical protein PYTT_1411 [Akkermansia glycaniphila]
MLGCDDTMARRRRKSKGPKTGVNWKRRLTIIAAALVLVCLLAVGGGYLWLTSYLSGSSFRSSLEDRFMRELRADHVALGNLDWAGGKIGMPKAQVEMRGALNMADARDIEVSLNRSALWDRLCHIPMLNIRSLDVRLDLSRRDVELPAYEAVEKGFFDSFAPNKTRVDRVIIRQLDVDAVDGPSSYSLQNARVTVKPGLKLDSFSASIQGGTLKLPLEWVRESELESMTASYTNGNLELRDGIFRTNPGNIVLERASWDRTDNLWSLLLRVNNANVERLLNPDWKKKLTGSLLGNVRMDGDASGIRHVSGKVNLVGGRLTALPVLERLSTLWDERYRSLSLDEAGATFSFPYNDPEKNIRNAWMIRNINVVSKGMIHVKGYAIIGQDRRLSGTLQIGIPARYVEMVPMLKEAVFNVRHEPDGGMLWANMNLSGTIDAPEDDLVVRAFSALGSATLGAATNAAAGVANTAAGTLKNLVSPSGGDKEAGEEEEDGKKDEDQPGGLLNKAVDGAGKALDTASDALKKLPL